MKKKKTLIWGVDSEKCEEEWITGNLLKLCYIFLYSHNYLKGEHLQALNFIYFFEKSNIFFCSFFLAFLWNSAKFP
jgi:hypothetical protein